MYKKFAVVSAIIFVVVAILLVSQIVGAKKNAPEEISSQESISEEVNSGSEEGKI